MINDLGFICIELQPNDNNNILLQETKKFINHYPNKQICIFNHHSDRADYYGVPILPLSHAKFFFGDLVIFDTISLILTQNFPNIKNRYFFTSDAPWKTNYNLYSFWQNIFNQDNLKIITDQPDIHNIYSICWDIPIQLVSNFSYEELENAIQKFNR